jgi:hypothetical protein
MPKAYRRQNQTLMHRPISAGEIYTHDEFVALTGGRDRRQRPVRTLGIDGKPLRPPFILHHGRKAS